jgi:hypothetical protein
LDVTDGFAHTTTHSRYLNPWSQCTFRIQNKRTDRQWIKVIMPKAWEKFYTFYFVPKTTSTDTYISNWPTYTPNNAENSYIPTTVDGLSVLAFKFVNIDPNARNYGFKVEIGRSPSDTYKSDCVSCLSQYMYYDSNA